MSENNNNDNKAITKNQLDTKAKAAVDPLLVTVGSKLPDEHIILNPRSMTETSIHPSTEKTSENSINFLSKSRGRGAAAAIASAEGKIAYQSLIQEVANRMRMSGPNRGAAVEFPDNFTATDIGAVYEQARKLITKQKEAEEEDNETRRAAFRDKIRELRESSVCPDCKTQLSFYDIYALDKHQKGCSAYQARLKQEQENEGKRTLYTNRFEQLLVNVKEAENKNEFRKAVAELMFARGEAVNTKDPTIVKVVDEVVNSKLHSKDFQARTMLKAIQLRNLAETKPIELREFADEIENWVTTLIETPPASAEAADVRKELLESERQRDMRNDGIQRSTSYTH